MPYIITTRKYDDPYAPNPALLDISRTAVATLDEARETVASIIDVGEATRGNLPGPSGDAYQLDAVRISADGGTVGPLPDGTVIEVRPIGWDKLATLVPLSGRGQRDRIVAAYNAVHA